jgi:hypothetical protein
MFIAFPDWSISKKVRAETVYRSNSAFRFRRVGKSAMLARICRLGCRNKQIVEVARSFGKITFYAASGLSAVSPTAR